MRKLLLVGFCLLGGAGPAAQAAESTGRLTREYELAAGSLLPTGIDGVTEVMPMVAFRYSGRIRVGVLEGDFAAGNASGASYRTLSLDYRYDLPDDEIRLFLLIGMQIDQWQGPGYDAQSTFGLNVGGGFFYDFSPRFALRADFRGRASPGRSVLFLAGPALRF